MSHPNHNAKWLQLMAPVNSISVSAAYLAPFFLERGLSLTQIFLLQSIYSIAAALWEIPSGFFADRFGRAFSIKISAPIAALALIGYSLSDQYWQFVACELALAIANGLLSGADTALLIDSLHQDQPEGALSKARRREYLKISQRIQALGYGSTAIGAPIGLVFVHFFGISSTLLLDGVFIGLASICALKLREVTPTLRVNSSQPRKLREEFVDLGRNWHVRWLIILGVALSTATYLGFWLSSSYYQSIGIPTALFGGLLAFRNLWKAWLSHRIAIRTNLSKRMLGFAVLALATYAAMASRQIWMLWAVLGHDAVEALHRQPLAHRVNDHFQAHLRATMNSVFNLARRLIYTIAGPLTGLAVERWSLQTAFLMVGVICAATAALAVYKLHSLNGLVD